MQNQPMGVAIIGYGGIGRLHHKKWLTALPEFSLCGVWDIERAACERAEEDGLAVYASEEALLADEAVSIVVVATPNDTHLPISLRAMKAGKHVICEKPVALNTAELEQMLACAEENRVVFTVNQNRRWDEDFCRIVKTAEEQTIGEIYRVESRVFGSRGIPGDWRKFRACGGGMVFDWGVHLIDQALMFAGKRKLCSVSAELDYIFGGECDDGFSVTMTFEGGLSYLAEVRTNNYIEMPRWYVAGQNGTMLIQNWNCEGEIVRKLTEDAEAKPIAAATGMSKTMAPRAVETIEHLPLPAVSADVADFYRHIRLAVLGQGSPDVLPDQLRRSMAVIEAVFRSAETHQAVTEFSF